MKINDDLFRILKCEDEEDIFFYHYTNMEGIKGIIENKSFWATNCSFLNDTHEFQKAFNMYREEILEQIPNEEIRKEIIDEYNKQVAEISLSEINNNESQSGYYVISFSLNPDNLALWSEFSDSMGYNLGFNINQFDKAFKSNIKWQGKVVYKYDEQIRMLKESYNNLLRGYLDKDSLTMEDFKRGIFPKKSISEFASCSSIFCLLYSMFFKESNYSQEEEYRFVFSYSDMEDVDKDYFIDNEVKYKIKNNALIPFVALNMTTLPIESVMIGPKNYADYTELGIRMFLKRHLEKQIENIKIIESSLSLRY